MNEHEQAALTALAEKLSKKSSAAIATFLIDRTKIYPYGVVEKAMLDDLADPASEGFVRVSHIIGRILQTQEGNAAKKAEDRQRAVEAEVRQRRRDIARQKQTADASVASAIDFCRAHTDELEEWRRQVEVVKPGLRWACKGKTTLDSPALMCAIFAEFSGGEVMA